MHRVAGEHADPTEQESAYGETHQLQEHATAEKGPEDQKSGDSTEVAIARVPADGCQLRVDPLVSL